MSTFDQIKYWVKYVVVLLDVFQMNCDNPRKTRELFVLLGGSTVDNTPNLPLSIAEVKKFTRLVMTHADLERIVRA